MVARELSFCVKYKHNCYQRCEHCNQNSLCEQSCLEFFQRQVLRAYPKEIHVTRFTLCLDQPSRNHEIDRQILREIEYDRRIIAAICRIHNNNGRVAQQKQKFLPSRRESGFLQISVKLRSAELLGLILAIIQNMDESS